MRQGMGSSLHVAAVFLGQALQHGHIFLWDPKGWHVGREYVDGGCGRGMGYSNWDWSAINLSETLPSYPASKHGLDPVRTVRNPRSWTATPLWLASVRPTKRKASQSRSLYLHTSSTYASTCVAALLPRPRLLPHAVHDNTDPKAL